MTEPAQPTWVLVGPPAAGKTTVGRLLAQRLGVSFRDVDAVIEARQQCSVSDIFASLGEDKFRVLERQTTLELLTKPGVLALGGGSVVNHDVRAALAGCDVIWLRCRPQTGTGRVGSSTHRPLLTGDVLGKLAQLSAQRLPYYRQVAKLAVDTDDKTPNQVTDEIMSQLVG